MPAGEWSKIEVNQILDGEEYTFSIVINETTVFSTTNNKVEDLSNVNIYASSPWARPQNGTIRSLTVENKGKGKLAFFS